MTRRLLDLFCGAGGAAYGYMRAGFHVTGVDITPQPRYRGDVFIQGDALEYLAGHGQEFDIIHASPPCQAYSTCTPMPYRAQHPRLIEPTRQALLAMNRPYVIENVENARRHLYSPFFLCGSMVGLPIWRHRYFETNAFPFPLVLCCNHSAFPVLISGTFRRKGLKRRDYTVAECRAAMDIDWMTGSELDEAIPPAYTYWIGQRILTYLETKNDQSGMHRDPHDLAHP